MKKFLSLSIGLFLCFAIWAQGFNYQALARDAGGNVLANQNLSVEVSIFENAFSTTPFFKEFHDVTTNAYGLFTLVIGRGTSQSTTFDQVDWHTTGHFLGIRVNAGSGLVDMGRTALQSVPYSKLADAAKKVTDASLSELTDVDAAAPADGQVLKWDAATGSWQPANDHVATGDGASVNTSARLAGDGSAANPLDLARQGAQNGQVLTWQNNNWQPVTPPGATYQAGTGIRINGDIISNTGDTDPTDDITSSTAAGGDLSGSFANLQIRSGVIGSNEIANGSIQAADLATGVIPATLPPSGAADGDLSGNFPNPTVDGLRGRPLSSNAPTNGQVLTWHNNNWQPQTPPTAVYQAGNGIAIDNNTLINTGDTNANDDITTATLAGGDLTGPFSNLQIKSNAVGTDEIANGSIQAADLANGILPTALPPNGAAGGDLSGIYPGPVVSGLRGRALSNIAPIDGQVLTWKNNAWQPLTPATGGDSFWSKSGNNLHYSTGNIGIGLNTPKNLLHLHNDQLMFGSPANLQLTSATTGTGTSNGLLLTLNNTIADYGLMGGLLLRENGLLAFGVNNAYHLFLAANGALGLGASNPKGKMEIRHNSGDHTTPQLMITENEANFGRISFQSVGVNNKYWTMAVRTNATDAASQFNFFYANGANGQNVLSLNGNGNVGIGTSTPERMLQLHFNNNNTSTSQFLISQNGTGDAFMNFGLGSGGHYALGIDNSDLDKFKIGYNPTQAGGVADGTVLSLDIAGNMEVSGEVNRANTGSANLLPFCYGHVNSSGVKKAGTNNFTVKKTGTGEFEITITGENFFFEDFITQVTAASGGVFATATSVNGKLKVTTKFFNGNDADSNFNFIVYKP